MEILLCGIIPEISLATRSVFQLTANLTEVHRSYLIKLGGVVALNIIMRLWSILKQKVDETALSEIIHNFITHLGLNKLIVFQKIAHGSCRSVSRGYVV
jgi:hypothetical protein